MEPPGREVTDSEEDETAPGYDSGEDRESDGDDDREDGREGRDKGDDDEDEGDDDEDEGGDDEDEGDYDEDEGDYDEDAGDDEEDEGDEDEETVGSDESDDTEEHMDDSDEQPHRGSSDGDTSDGGDTVEDASAASMLHRAPKFDRYYDTFFRSKEGLRDSPVLDRAGRSLSPLTNISNADA